VPLPPVTKQILPAGMLMM